MARPTLNSRPKYKRLIAMLDLPRPYVRGLLETLWETAHETGDPVIGTAADVEAAAEWPGEPGVLSAALFDLRFLDEVGDDETDATDATDRDGHPSHPSRYELHDYFDHAPEYAKGRGQRESERKKLKSCDGCETDFRSSDPRAKYCSSACRKKAWRDRQADSATDRDGSRRIATDRDGTPAPAPAPIPKDPEHTRAKPPAGKTDMERDILAEQEASERLSREYPAHRFLNVLAIQREFHDLWRLGQLPPMEEFFATLDAYKRSPQWRKDGGEFVPHCEKWLRAGGWKRRPPDSGSIPRRYPTGPRRKSPAELAEMSKADREAYIESLDAKGAA